MDLSLLEEIIALGKHDLRRYKDLWIQRSLDQLRKQPLRCTFPCSSCVINNYSSGWQRLKKEKSQH